MVCVTEEVNMMTPVELSNKLKESQHQTDDPDKFERLLADAFNALGLPAKHLGRSNKADILIDYDNEKIVVDAKTVQKDSAIGESSLGLPAQARYKEQYNAGIVAIVGASFRSGNAIKSAKKQDIILIETKAICRLLENHAIYRYNTKTIYNLLFKGGDMVTEKDINPSHKENAIHVEVLNALLNTMFKRSKSLTIEQVYNALTLGLGKDYSKENISEAMRFLVEFNIVLQQGEFYSLTRDIDKILDDIGLLCLSIKGQTSVKSNPATQPNPVIDTTDIPQIDTTDAPKYIKQYYNQLKTSNTLASFIRNLIRQKQEITRRDIDLLVKEDNRAISGGVHATIILLRDYTKEIEESGKGDNSSYKWIGQ